MRLYGIRPARCCQFVNFWRLRRESRNIPRPTAGREPAGNLAEGWYDRAPDKTGYRRIGVNDCDDFSAVIHGTDDGDLGEIGNAGEDNPLIATFLRRSQ